METDIHVSGAAAALVGIPMIIGIVDAIKRTGSVSPGWLPLLAIGVGLVLGIVAALALSVAIGTMLVVGITSGVAAAGTYKAVEATAQAVRGG